MWCHIDNYPPILRTLFRDASRVRQEDLALLEHCNGTTLSELKRDTGLSEEDIRESMNRLEAAYLVRRKLRGGVQVFIRNDLEAQDMDREEALRAAVRRVLHSYGPLTIEEVLIRIPVGQEEVERALDAMVSSGEITRDFVTPVFAPPVHPQGRP
ncbi:hypothetical protein [Thermogymnomonas acidicola]|uniref:hypothetical protein n=1 Tax=Thermogymnomonas acidicola TaxID=399579 RepID=UPI0013967C21|nr:hypothetical protein [Thermogymnomonas acidicola]